MCDKMKCILQFVTIYLFIYGRLTEKLSDPQEDLCSRQLVPTHRASGFGSGTSVRPYVPAYIRHNWNFIHPQHAFISKFLYWLWQHVSVSVHHHQAILYKMSANNYRTK
jgi:hypothetical protein